MSNVKPKRRATATQRLAKARRLLDKWTRSIARNSRFAERAAARGDVEKAAVGTRRAAAARRNAKGALKRIERYAPIAGIQVAADRLAGEIILAGAVRLFAEPPTKKPKKTRKAKDVPSKAVIVDIVADMARRGRIDGRGRRAAEIYRNAHDAATSYGMSGTLNPDKLGGGGRGKSGGIPEAIADAAGWLNAADVLLGPRANLLREVVGEGQSVEEIARRRGFGNMRRRIARTYHHLAQALAVLADAWLPIERERSTIRGHRAPGAKPTDDGKKTTFERMSVAHASKEKRVSFSEPSSTRKKAKRA